MVFGNASRHGDAQPHSGLLVTDESLEHLGKDVRGDSRTVVAHKEFDVAISRRAKFDLHDTASGHGIEGV